MPARTTTVQGDASDIRHTNSEKLHIIQTAYTNGTPDAVELNAPNAHKRPGIAVPTLM